MDIAVYCGKWILPAKNGTHYLDKIFNPKLSKIKKVIPKRRSLL